MNSVYQQIYSEFKTFEATITNSEESLWFLELYDLLMPFKDNNKDESNMVIVFCKRRSLAELLSKYFENLGFACSHMMASNSANSLKSTVASLKNGRKNILFATNIVAEGFDIQKFFGFSTSFFDIYHKN